MPDSSSPTDKQMSPGKHYRAALLKNRFADTILKAREKTLAQVGNVIYMHIPTMSRIICLTLVVQFDLNAIRVARMTLRKSVERGKSLKFRGGKVMVQLGHQYFDGNA